MLRGSGMSLACYGYLLVRGQQGKTSKGIISNRIVALLNPVREHGKCVWTSRKTGTESQEAASLGITARTRRKG